MGSMNNERYRYKIDAQNFPRDLDHCILVIEDIFNNELIHICVSYLWNDKDFLAQMSPEDNRLIGYIYAMEVLQKIMIKGQQDSEYDYKVTCEETSNQLSA